MSLRKLEKTLGLPCEDWIDRPHYSYLTERQEPTFSCKIVQVKNGYEWTFDTHTFSETPDSGIVSSLDGAKLLLEQMIQNKFPNHVRKLNAKIRDAQ